MKNRYFQFLRGILIICVVLIHTMYKNEEQWINYFNISLRNIINFCVSIFIFISAYFTDKERIKTDYKNYVIRRFERLCIPLLLWSLIYMCVNIIFNKNILTNIKSLIYNSLTFSWAPQFYYILVLIQLTILTPIILKILEKHSIIKILLYLITPIYLISILIINFIFKANLIFYHYYIFGWLIYYLIGLEKEKIKCTKYNRSISIVLLILGIITNCLI